MNYNDLEFLTRIYNALLLVSTKGEDTMIMGECLHALKGFVTTKSEELAAAEQQATAEEEE